MMRWRDERGFTMVETLVALVVFCMIAAAVQMGLSATWRNARIADGQERALAHAKHLLAEAGVSRPLMLGAQSGSVDDTMHWRIAVEPVAQAASLVKAFDKPAEPEPHAVDVTVTWRDATSKERSVSLRTIKIGRTVP